MPHGERWIFDTSVYIGAIRGDPEAFEVLEATLPRTHLCSVVVAELRAGATTDRARRAVQRFAVRARKVGRVVVPTVRTWERAGDVMAALRRSEPQLRTKLRGLWNDLLIGMCGLQIGATVVTHDAPDFEILHRYAAFRLRVLDAW